MVKREKNKRTYTDLLNTIRKPGKPNIERHEPTKNKKIKQIGVNSGAPERQAVPAPLMECYSNSNQDFQYSFQVPVHENH